jgi:predicted transcriptional regulator
MAEPHPHLLDDVSSEADERALLEAEADADAGRVVPHARVREWLKSLGTPDQKPTPFSWRK